MRSISIPSASDAPTISAAHKEIDRPRGVLLIAHGMAEHKARYYDFMEFLAECGIAAMIWDHRGHGEGAERLGYIAGGADTVLADLARVAAHARALYPEAKQFLLGHSMGALVARAYIQTYDGCSGLLLSGNPAYSPFAPAALRYARRAQNRRGAYAMARALSFGMYAPFMLGSRAPFSRNGWLCADRAVVRAYDKDPLCGFAFTANGYEALFDLMQRAQHPPAPIRQPNLPIALYSGARDACAGGEKGAMRAVRQLADAGYRTVEYKIYPKM
ncbi:MAG: alpha/beta fold hydrolase, partial [Christensenellales bacterium]